MPHKGKKDYKAPDYLDKDTGGLSRVNRGNEGVELGKEARAPSQYATGTQWADESPGKPDYSDEPAGPIAGHKSDAQMATGDGYRSPGAEEPRSLAEQFKVVCRARGINPKGQTVPATDTQGQAVRPFAAEAEAVEDYATGQFEEGKHPRGKGGKFATKGTGREKPVKTEGWRELPKKVPSLPGQLSMFADLDIRSEAQRRADERAKQPKQQGLFNEPEPSGQQALFSRPASQHLALCYARHCDMAAKLGRDPMPERRFVAHYSRQQDCPELYGKPGEAIFNASAEDLERYQGEI